jgi:hypothetical protein
LAHLYLAYHAALPLALTPELLYQIRANFPQDINGKKLDIPWEAAANLLLSNLCKEVRHKLYEMDGVIRQELLQQLSFDLKFGRAQIERLANFLLDYIQSQLHSDDPDLRDFAESQEWVALAYVRPSESARKIALFISQLSLEHRLEWMRLGSLIETLAEPLSEEYQQLTIYVQGIISYARGEIEPALAQLRKIAKDTQIQVAGIDLPIPPAIKQILPPADRVNEDDPIKQQKAKDLRQRLVALGVSISVGIGGWIVATNIQKLIETLAIDALVRSSSDLFASGKELDGLIAALKAARKFRSADIVNPNTQNQVLTTLLASVYGISERNSLEGHQSSVLSVSFSPDGQTLATGSNDKTIKVWNLATGKEIRTLQGHQSIVYSVSFSPDGQTLATGSEDYTIKLWNVGFDSLTGKGCEWLYEYLSTNPKVTEEERQMCGITR